MLRTRKSLILGIRDHANQHYWREFLRTYQPLITHYALKAGIPRHAQEDISQEVLLIVMRNSSRLEFRDMAGSFRQWLKTITHNKVVDWFRRQQQAQRLQRTKQRSESHDAAQPPPVDESPRQHLVAQALVQVRQVVSGSTWQCFEEHVLKQRRAKEVASELNTTENAVYVNSTRVLARIRAWCSAGAVEPDHAT